VLRIWRDVRGEECDNSCLMHIQGALHRQKTGVRTVHLAEILAGEEGTVSRKAYPRG
jgi:hypothetical protein